MRRLCGTLFIALLLPIATIAKTEGKVNYDSRGHAIRFPLGDLSFADEMVSFTAGDPPTSVATAGDPKEALGPPNYSGKQREKSFLTLGCGGTLTLRFTNNVLVDVPGPDLFVFEVGPDIETTKLSISRDGRSWIDGEISGGTAAVDQGSAVARAPVPATQSAPQSAAAADLSLRVVDRRKARPLAHRKVFIYADNGVRCIKAPCMTNGAQWEGRTDAKGYVTVPAQFRLASMSIWAEGYGAPVDLIDHAVRIKPNSWRIALRRDR